MSRKKRHQVGAGRAAFHVLPRVAGGRCRCWRWTWHWPWMWARSGGGGRPGCWPRQARARDRRRHVPPIADRRRHVRLCPSACRGHHGGPDLGLGACGAFDAAGAGFTRPSAVPGGHQTSVGLWPMCHVQWAHAGPPLCPPRPSLRCLWRPCVSCAQAACGQSRAGFQAGRLAVLHSGGQQAPRLAQVQVVCRVDTAVVAGALDTHGTVVCHRR